MSATMLKVGECDRDQSRWSPRVAPAPGPRLVLEGLAAAARSCPHCGAPVYTRRHDRCGVCEGTLPSECRFTHQEAQQIRRLFDDERRQHREWIRKLAS